MGSFMKLTALHRLEMEKLFYFTFMQFSFTQILSLLCYTDPEATTYQFCNEHDGYNTCFASYDKYGQIKERGCSTKENICDDLSSSETAYGFPVSRGCKNKEKISVKTRDCENRMENGTFLRVCYCRKRLCNVGYDPILEITGGVRYQYKPYSSSSRLFVLPFMIFIPSL